MLPRSSGRRFALASWRLIAAFLGPFLAAFLGGCTKPAEPAFPSLPYLFAGAAQEAARVERIACSIPVEGAQLSVEEAMRRYNVAGVSAAAMVQGRVVWARGWGYADRGRSTAMTAETVLQAASISKPISTVGVLRMVQEGRLDLDQDVADLVGGWEATFQNRPVKISLRQLLSHSAGLGVHGFGGFRSNVEDLPSTTQILNGEGNSARVRVEYPPGDRTQYSGGGFTVVQAAVEDELGDPFDQAMYDWLIRPFRLTRSTYEQPISALHARTAATAHGADGRPMSGRWNVYPMQAAAGLWTTPTDLLTLASSLAAAYNGAAGPLSSAMVRVMLTPQSANGKVGLGWFLSQKGDVIEAFHNGRNAGFSSEMLWRTDGMGAAVMVNGEGPIAHALLRAIGEEYGWRPRSGSSVCGR